MIKATAAVLTFTLLLFGCDDGGDDESASTTTESVGGTSSTRSPSTTSAADDDGNLTLAQLADAIGCTSTLESQGNKGATDKATEIGTCTVNGASITLTMYGNRADRVAAGDHAQAITCGFTNGEDLPFVQDANWFAASDLGVDASDELKTIADNTGGELHTIECD
jgi:hypothetical protein